MAGYVSIDEIIDYVDQVKPRVALGGSASYSAIALSSMKYPHSVVTKVGSDFPSPWSLLLREKGGIDVEEFRDMGEKTTSFRIDRSVEPRKLRLLSRCRQLTFHDFQTYIGKTSHNQTLVLNPIAGEISLSLLDRLSKEFGFVLVDSQGFVRRISQKTYEVSMHSGLDISSLSGVDVLKADRQELCAWTGSKNIDSTIRQISKFVNYILLTSGGETVDLLEDGKLSLRAVPNPTRAVDTTGAGDIMLATFAGRYSETADIKESLALSVSAASLSVRKSGVEKAILDKMEVEADSKNVRIRTF